MKSQELRLNYLNLKVEIKDREFYCINKLVNQIEIRNTIIRAFWEGLKYSEHSYKEKKNIVAREFIITEVLVERIITRNC